MCKHIQSNTNLCALTKQSCPYMYYCNRKHMWIESKYKPAICKVEKQKECPIGYNRVIQIRHGLLYIEVDGKCIKIQNPFEYEPKYVKLVKTKDGDWTVER